MIVRMGLLRRRPDLSREQFSRHWRDIHGPLARQMPGLRGYHQNHVVDDRQLGVDHSRGAWDIDGISELWFDSAEAMEAAIASPAYQPVRDDSPAFLAETRVITAEQRTVKAFDGASRAIKRMSIIRRKPEITPQQFRHEWFEVHGEYVKAFPTLLGYRQNLILTRQADPDAGGSYATVPADGIVEMWFADEAALATSFGHEAAVRSQAHAHTFLAEITPFLVEVHAIV